MPEPVVKTTSPTPKLHKQRTALMDDLKRKDWDFLKHPTMELAEEMAELREQIGAIDRRIVMSLVFTALIDEAMENSTPDDEDIYMEEAHGY